MENLNTANLEVLTALHLDTAETTIAENFHRVFHLANAYYDDPAECLAITNAVCRAATDNGSYDAEGTVRRALELIFDRVLDLNLMPGIPQQAVYCWMLKDSSSLTYAEIAYLLDITRLDVRDNIAAVRNRLLDSCQF